MNIIIALAAFGTAAAAGYLYGRRFYERERFFADAATLCDMLVCEIGYTNEPIAALLGKACGTVGHALGGVIDGYIAGEEIKCPGILKPDDFSSVDRLFSLLGKSDAVGQAEGIACVKTALVRKLEEARAEKPKYNLYTRLGILGGLALAILII
ncbi:MAG: stage III sporulation protein AB [Firmicutes bacterium]|nr:stage III sporulation protein AB [Bacillota bacterium]